MALVVVIGATGFVGRNLVQRLAGDGYDVWAVSKHGARAPEASRSFGMADLGGIVELPADTVVCHVAAHRYDAGSFAMAQSDILTENVQATNQVYAFCARLGVTEVRLASSVAVYEASRETLDDAEPVDLMAEPHPNEAFYAWSKRWAEIAADQYRRKYGIATVAFRLSNPYGPFDSTDPGAAHVLPAFVMRALAPGEVFALRGDPMVERDFIFVDDVVDVFARSIPWRARSDVMNLCRGQTTTLLDLAQTIVRVSGADKRIETESDFAPAAVRVRRSTSDRVRKAFGIGTFASLEDGLPATISWYREALGA